MSYLVLNTYLYFFLYGARIGQLIVLSHFHTNNPIFFNTQATYYASVQSLIVYTH